MKRYVYTQYLGQKSHRTKTFYDLDEIEMISTSAIGFET